MLTKQLGFKDKPKQMLFYTIKYFYFLSVNRPSRRELVYFNHTFKNKIVLINLFLHAHIFISNAGFFFFNSTLPSGQVDQVKMNSMTNIIDLLFLKELKCWDIRFWSENTDCKLRSHLLCSIRFFFLSDRSEDQSLVF